MMSRDADVERELERLERGPNRVRGAIIAVAAVLVAAAVAFAAWWFLAPPDFSSYADKTVRIEGISDEPVTLTVAEIAQLGSERVSASGKNAVGANASAEGYGPSIDTLLANYGRSRDEYVKMRVHCLDGYKVVLREDDLREYATIVLSIADAHGPLHESSQPARLIIPGADSNRWCYAIESIEFLETDPGVETDSTAKSQG